MRLIYMYDMAKSDIIESHIITDQDEDYCEWLKLSMLVRCKYPCEVIDTAEEDSGQQRQYLHKEIARLHSLSEQHKHSA